MKPFFWGVATSAYQSEGGYNGPGEPPSNWAKAEARRDVMISGRAANFWECYEDDFARCEAMGLNAFRLGIEWTRVQPGSMGTDGKEPQFDFGALDHYVAILAACRRHGLEPVLTLHHFVHPAWLGADPWLDPATPERFETYVRTVVSHVNDSLVRTHNLPPLRYYITINEPNMLALNTYLGNQFPGEARRGIATINRSYNQLLCGHIRAYNRIHDLHAQHGWGEALISLNNYCSDLYWSDKLLLDLLSVRERGVAREDTGDYIVEKARQFRAAFDTARIPLHRDLSYLFGAAVKRLSDWTGQRFFHAKNFGPLLDAIYASPRARLFDFLGLDYYDPFMAHAFRLPVIWDHEFKNKSFHSWVMASISSKWWDWRVLPRGLHFFCDYYSRDFAGRAVLIAENGMALRRLPDNRHSQRRDGMIRSEFLRLHVHEVVKIVNAGIPLFGYLHWSLFDNYEWGSFTPRFGLFSLDYTRDTERLVADHLGDRPSETYSRLIREARQKLASNSPS
jgi:beta-glucosidase/6-phospho-beta-glucosidase/beta-galactosidase